MADQPTTAGPAIAAHSKDASTPGPTPAAAATGTQGNGHGNGVYGHASDWARQARTTVSNQGGQAAEAVAGYVREQPITALAITAGIGLILGALLARSR